MQKFVKDERFIMPSKDADGKDVTRLFLILSGMDYDPAFNQWTPPNQVGNVIRFIEIEKDRTYTDVFGRVRPTEIKPKLIPTPKNEDEILYNKHAVAEGILVRDKAFLYKLVEEGKIVMG